MIKINKVFILAVGVFLIFIADSTLKAKIDTNGYTGESIQYIIKPAGKSEYKNLGEVDLNGVKVNLITLKSKILFIDITEKIFYNAQTLLPYRTERMNKGFWLKEYRTEDYDQQKFTVVIKKFKGAKLVREKKIQASGPIQNVNLLIFYLREQPDFKIGWHFTANILEEFKFLKIYLKLFSIEEIVVPAGKFKAYHFKSVPEKFEIWMNKDDPQIALKIKIKNIIDCSILMIKYQH
jgi:hypothetical protein